jgi:hypothetical protein
MVATIAADGSQHQSREKPLFEEAARAGAVSFVVATFAAAELLEITAPGRG